MAALTRTKSKSLASPSSSITTPTLIQIPQAPNLPINQPTLSTLPPELHLLISAHLTYPDALSLKHTNRHFYNLVYTGVDLKIEWLIERRTLHLDCPHDRKCELGSDMRFCRGSVRLLMKRRREHGECDTGEGGRGCLVFGTRICTFRRKRIGLLEKIRSSILRLGSENVLVWWMCLAVMGALLGWVCLEVQKMHVQPLLL
ncbi:hypothetical protein LHYA1_G007449 [Lachnellula hyalina]|uniref:F-box domain-containing protein n=1 Tax=Lachnellula hyalina TaxID=1316788 RepID=A0A8H8QYB6_9HELO|nr:uncharacterized protein LHYA1_G007449 [Lachnellula hyalina]TVY24380.1 hypothetical protein LHYA1_G007449 [Lachnellula hyalina]